MYHAVAEGCTDPWSLCVSPQRFARQLEVLRKHAQPTRLQQLVAAFHGGEISRRAVIVTFDDGYADNLFSAKPLLESFDIPATVFLTAGYIGDSREFWWDELDKLLLQPGTIPKILRLSVNGIPHQWELGEAATIPKSVGNRIALGKLRKPLQVLVILFMSHFGIYCSPCWKATGETFCNNYSRGPVPDQKLDRPAGRFRLKKWGLWGEERTGRIGLILRLTRCCPTSVGVATE
jgi:peptidoglycan/xylan/chitin deacetylase (PgdA/CDA1 family)